MRVKKWISVLSACSMLCCMGVTGYAEKDSVTISHEFGVGNAYKTISVQILAPGATVEAIKDDNAETSIAYAGFRAANASGKLEFSYNPNKAGGIYIVRMNCGGELVTQEFVYFTENEMNTYLKTLTTLEDFEKLFTTQIDDIWGYERLGLQNQESFTLFDTELTDDGKKQVAQYLYNNRSSIATVEDLYTLFNANVIQTLFKNAGTADDWNRYLSSLYTKIGFAEDSVYHTLYTTNLYTDAAKKYAAEVFVVSEVNSAETLRHEVEEAILLGAFAGVSSYTQISDIITAGEDMLTEADMDFEKYDSLKSKVTVYKELVGYKGKTVEELADSIDELVTEAKSDKDSSGKTSVRVSGGSSSHSASFESAVQQNKDDKSDKTIVAEREETVSFTDIDGHWAKTQIEALAKKGVVAGREKGLFCPDDTVTREEFVKMLMSHFEIPLQNDKTAFADASSADWYYTYVVSAEKLNLIKGYNGIFGVGEEISRQDAAVMIQRFAEYVGKQISTDVEPNFTDASVIADYAREAVAVLAGNNIITGFEDGSFRPEESITRAQAAKLLYEIGGMNNETE